MIKLVDLLKEIKLEEKIVKVPQTVLAKSKEAFNYIKNNLERFKDQAPKSYRNPDIDAKFRDYFKFKDLKNQDLSISIGFYNDPKDVGAGRMDNNTGVLLVNLAYFDPEDLEYFKELIEHELVHAMDPKIKDMGIYAAKIDPETGRERGGIAKKGAEPSGSRLNLSKSGGKSEYTKNLEKYLKSPWEFDAFTAPLVNTIKFSLQKIQDPNQKQDYIKLINNLLSDIKTKDIKQILDDSKYEKLPWFFSKQKWDAGNFNNVLKTYDQELYKMKAWATKPTLYQRFTKRLGQEII
jgi:hypothetical protein